MTPKQVVLVASAIISALATGLFKYLAPEVDNSRLGIFALVVFLICGVLIFRFTSHYLYRKLLPIYRIISGMTTKSTIPVKNKVLDSPLEDAEQHVIHWADERIREIRSLQEQDSFRREFIGNLAHELKTPLFNIQGYVSSLLEGAMDDEKVKEKFLQKANKNIERMTRIVEDLDTISHLESGSVTMELAEMDVVACARDMVDNLEKKASNKEIEVRISRKDPIMVMADEFRIGQVFTNLVNNAITYGNEGGWVEIRFTDFEGRVLIEVVDSGPGIEESKIPRLFERFYRVDQSRSRDVGGTGLGLAIVKHIIESHDQGVSAKSVVGEGSNFSFTLSKA